MSRFFGNSVKKILSRHFHRTVARLEEKKPAETKFDDGGLNSVKVRPFDKYLFVWCGRYKRREDVPDRVARSTIEHIHNVCRVKTCNYMMVGFVILAVITYFKAKHDREQGMTLTKKILQRHQEYYDRVDKKNAEEENKKLASSL